MTLPDQVAAYIRRHAMLAPTPQAIGVAVSGGADSVVLLHLLYLLRPQFAYRLHVLHVNHHLRGAESDADELFVRRLAESLGLPFSIEQALAPSSQIERHARDLRRAFFARAVEQHSLAAVALGHTRSDQAETVLFRLLRGSGVTGLAAMRPVTADRLIRPLLDSTRAEVRAWAVSANLSWRDDSSNLDISFTRNRLRLETLPALAATYNPNLETLLAHSASLAQTEEDFWNIQIDSLFSELVVPTRFGLTLSAPKLAALHLALRRRLVRRCLSSLRGHLNAISFDHVESILALCHSTDGHSRVLVPGVDALRSFDSLLLAPAGLRPAQPRDYQLDLAPSPLEHELPYQTGFISVQYLERNAPTADYVTVKKEADLKVEVADLDADLLGPFGALPPLCVRNWQPGDVFQRAGHHSAEKIKTLFQSARVLLWERKHWPVLTAGSHILWTRQFGVSAQFCPADGSRRIIRIIFRPA